jgi:single-strand DNA-binding protein
MNLNRVTLIGRIGQDPETSIFNSRNGERHVAKFSIATTRSWKDKQTGNQNEETEWHRCAAFGGSGKYMADHGSKGRLVRVEGRLKTSTYEKEGQTHYSTEVIVDDVMFLDPKPKAIPNENPADRVRNGARDALDKGGW